MTQRHGLKLPILKGAANYKDWASTISFHPKGQDLRQYVTQTEDGERPEAKAGSSAARSWRVGDNKAISIIYQSSTPKVRTQVQEKAGSSKELWDYMKQQYEKTEYTVLESAADYLVSLKIEKCDDVEDYNRQ